MTEKNAEVKVVTEWGLRFPDGHIDWGRVITATTHAALHNEQDRRLVETWVKDKAHKAHLDPEATWRAHQWVTRTVTTITTEPVLVNG